MKSVYIPKGETVHYESLVTDRLVVRGCLDVTYGIKAKTISGNGVICAGTVAADDIRIDDLEAATVTCKRLLAKRVQAPEVFASEIAAVSCFLSAAYVETGKLTVAISEVQEVKAGEVINLSTRRRSLLWLLLVSALRSFWVTLTSPAHKREVMDAAYEQIEDEAQAEYEEVQPADKAPEVAEPIEEEALPVDEELNRIVGIFNLLRDSGYTLKIIPGTPEENAPVFDLKNQCIVRPAA